MGHIAIGLASPAQAAMIIEDLQAGELLGREVAFRLALAAALGQVVDPAQAAQELGATAGDPAAAHVIASAARDGFAGLSLQKCECATLPNPTKGTVSR